MSSSTDTPPQVGFATTGTTQSNPQMSRNKSNDNLTCTSSKEQCRTSSDSRKRAESGNAEVENEDPRYANRTKTTMPSLVNSSVETLLEKIDWGSEQLRSSRNVERSTQISVMLKSCAEAIAALQNVQQGCSSCKKMRTDTMDIDK